jgi:DNA-binding HxlR family transcriptional regulator
MTDRIPPNIAPSIFYKTEICPIRTVISKISGKWPLLVLAHLSFGHHRFSELLNGLPDISQRMLTQTLRRLERDGLVARSVKASIPPRVDYQLTERGHTILPALQALMQWGLENQQDISRAQAAYDAEHGLTEEKPKPSQEDEAASKTMGGLRGDMIY